MYVCVVLPLTSEGPHRRGRTPPEATRSPSPVSYLLWGWGWDPSLPTLGSDRDNPDTSQTCNQPHQTNLSSGSSSRSLLFDDLELCAAPFTTARTSPAHHEVALRYLRVFWILRSEGLLPRLLVLPAFFVSVSGPENPFFVCWIEINVPCDRSYSPEKEQNQNFSTFVQPRAQTTGRHARDREGG